MKRAHFFSPNQHVEVGAKQHYFIVNLPLSGGEVWEDSSYQIMANISLIGGLGLTMTPAELFRCLFRSALHSSLLPEHFWRVGKDCFNSDPMQKLRNRLRCVSEGFPPTLALGAFKFVTSNVSDPSDLLHHAASSQTSFITALSPPQARHNFSKLA